MKKVLITGNSGYIGSHLSCMLEDDYEVYGLDVRLPQTDRLRDWYNIDIRSLFSIDVEFDTVVHLAALVNVGESERNPSDYYETNLTGTINAVKCIKAQNFIFASTGAAADCKSAYAISKRAAEDVVKQHCKQYSIFRFYNVIGSNGFAPTNPDGLMYNLLQATKTGSITVYGTDYNTRDGTCIRDYVHVNEICTAIKRAIEKPTNQTQGLGHGVGYTVAEIIDVFATVNNVTIKTMIAPRRPGDLESSVVEAVSDYMSNQYTLCQLLQVKI